MDEALFSGIGREVKTKQITTFAGLTIISLMLIHRSIILALPFFLLGLVYLNYSDDILPISSYLSVLQQYRKLQQKQKEKVKQTEQLGQKNQLKLNIRYPISTVKLPHIPTEIQLTLTSIITIISGIYGIYQSVFSENFAGLIIGAVLVALGLVIMLAVISPFLNKLKDENPNV